MSNLRSASVGLLGADNAEYNAFLDVWTQTSCDNVSCNDENLRKSRRTHLKFLPPFRVTTPPLPCGAVNPLMGAKELLFHCATPIGQGFACPPGNVAGR